MNSIGHLSQSFDKREREPLSPSKINLENNINSSSRHSQVTFSPDKGQFNSNHSNVSYVSPSKFEKFVKIDLQAVSNPFRVNNRDSMKFVI